jgi:predicted HTH transcriptional regulator
LDYREKLDETARWSDRVVSNMGEWSGNLFDFYFKIIAQITSGIKTPFKLLNGIDRIDDTPIHEAIREAVTNALIHSNYYERRGLVFEKTLDGITISNPGTMRISVDEAVSGGVSDPRNANIFKMFSLVGIGERAGSGLYSIHSVWHENGLDAPTLVEQFNPDRTILKLRIELEIKSKNNLDTTTDDGLTTTDTTTDDGLTTTDDSDVLSDAADKYDSVMNFCSVPRSRAEIQEFLQLKNKNYFIKAYLNPLLESGKITMTIPDKPNSKNQKYVAIT